MPSGGAFRWRDFRSDTVTQPTQEMRDAMRDAEVGDDILGEDPTVQELERYSAELFRKEAGLLVVSGTMANQVAIQALTERGDEILVDESSHMFNLEVGGVAALSGVQTRPLRSRRGRLDLEEVRQAIRARGLQAPVTRVICIENTYDANRGIPLPPEYFAEVAAVVKERGVALYVDGARIFNAAVALGVGLPALAEHADALMFSLTKGLSAPFGAVLVGSREFIDRCRWVKQRMGGGMRQAGHMAAAGLVALRTMRDRLVEDHAHAKLLAQGLAEIHPGLVDVEMTLTNMVYVDFAPVGMTSAQVAEKLYERGFKIKPLGPTTCRMATHRNISRDDVEALLEAVGEIIRGR